MASTQANLSGSRPTFAPLARTQGRTHLISSQASELVGILLKAAAVLGGFALLAVLGGCSEAHSQDSAIPPPPIVTVSEVVRREVADWDAFTGRFEAVERVELKPRVSGYIDSVSFAEGALVERGQVLFQIDARPYQAALDQARAELDRAQAQYALSGSELTRAETLLESKAISREEYDQRVSGRSQNQANLKAAQAAVAAAALNVRFTRVLAPIDGRVSRAEITAGNYVTAGQSLLTTVVSVDPIYVYFDGDEQTYLKYSNPARSGRPDASGSDTPVHVGLADEQGYPHDGRLDFIDNALDPATGTIRARAVLDNPDGRLTPGLFARVQLRGSGATATTLIDERAIGTDQDRKYVYVIDESNAAQYRRVDLGDYAHGQRIVRAGLKPGERIVVSGLAKIRPGMTVNPEAAPPAQAAADSDELAFN
ncbi:MAG: efflux RND transporter periplasmic adaptor subunit [Gammaproteobacteria bacterium]|nr:efflux RND transporter periplasmic adaptor subunit [Gammaproteobacteria bacterium]